MNQLSLSDLKPRQLEVLEALVKHGSMKAVAKAIGLSPHYVGEILGDTYELLGINSSNQLIAWYYEVQHEALRKDNEHLRRLLAQAVSGEVLKNDQGELIDWTQSPLINYSTDPLPLLEVKIARYNKWRALPVRTKSLNSHEEPHDG